MAGLFKNLLGGKSGETDLENDPRWRRIHNREWTCACCGNTYSGIPDLTASKPRYWADEGAPVSNDEVFSNGRLLSDHFVSYDLCIVDGEYFFVRGVLEIPIVGSGGETFGYGAWVSLSEKSFHEYLAHFDDGAYGPDERWYGWFSSAFKGYDDMSGLKCAVIPRSGQKRPLFELEPTDHLLSVEQHQGITFDRLLEIHAVNGHDLAVNLGDA